MNIHDFTPLIWAAFALVCVVVFKGPLGRLIDRVRGFDIDWTQGKLSLTAAEANEVAQTLLAETIQMIGALDSVDRRVFGRIVKALESGQKVTLDSLFPPAFKRRDAQDKSTSELTSLRKLRDAQLIRPKNGGQFKDNKEIELKRFGEILLRTHRDKLIKENA